MYVGDFRYGKRQAPLRVHGEPYADFISALISVVYPPSPIRWRHSVMIQSVPSISSLNPVTVSLVSGVRSGMPSARVRVNSAVPRSMRFSRSGRRPGPPPRWRRGCAGARRRRRGFHCYKSTFGSLSCNQQYGAGTKSHIATCERATTCQISLKQIAYSQFAHLHRVSVDTSDRLISDVEPLGLLCAAFRILPPSDSHRHAQSVAHTLTMRWLKGRLRFNTSDTRPLEPI